MKFSWFPALVLLILTDVPVMAQFYDTGQDPGSLKWMQVKTDRFRVIYPESFGKSGIEFAKSLEEAWSELSPLYRVDKIRIPVILHNYTTQLNGYVSWAPKRIEIYPTPEQNSIPLEPYKYLAIHELTHVLQIQSLNKGFTKFLSFVSGEQSIGMISSMLPLWFLEGDAVFSESWFTGSGRGRSPYFQKQLRTLLLEKGDVYSFDKSINGSFRDYVPDHYQYGYQMITWSYLKYGRLLWQNVLDKTGKAPFLINPVNFSLYKDASLTKKRLFREAFDSLKVIWEEEDRLSESSSYKILNPPRGENYVNYHSPVTAGNDSIIAVRTSLTEPPSIVLIRPSEQSEKKIAIPGNAYPWFITFGSGKLCWIETHSDPRWQNREWTVIKKMDLKSRKISQLSFRTRFMAVSISPDGNYIAAVENTIENTNNLVIVDAWNGDLLESIPSPGNAALQRPQWDSRGENIIVISLTEQGEGILGYNTISKQWLTYFEEGKDDLQSAFLRNDSLFFVSSWSGIDNIYLKKQDGPVVRLTGSRFGAADLNLSGNLLLFSDYSSYGNSICSTPLSAKETLPLTGRNLSSFLINRIETAPSSQIRVNTAADYAPVSYRKWQHLFRFHSWMPFYADLDKIQSDPSSVKPGFTLMSQNHLSTLISTLGYEHSDNRHKFHSSLKWTGWYLILESEADYGNNPYIEKFGETVENPVGVLNGYSFTNTVSLPLIFRGGRFTKNLYLSGASKYNNNSIYLKSKKVYDTGQNQITSRLYFSNYQRSAVRDIYPRWAQVLDLSYSYFPFDKDIYGDQLAMKSAFYFPGIVKNHGFRLRFEKEKQDPRLFVMSNRVSFPRGVKNITSPDIKYASADYYMPLVYPDLNLPGLLYITRIRTGFFYDYSKVNSYYLTKRTETGNRTEFYDIPASFRSYGLELLSDFYLFRIPFMISAGMQASWQRDASMPDLEMIFRLDLFGMTIGKKKL